MSNKLWIRCIIVFLFGAERKILYSNIYHFCSWKWSTWFSFWTHDLLLLALSGRASVIALDSAAKLGNIRIFFDFLSNGSFAMKLTAIVHFRNEKALNWSISNGWRNGTIFYLALIEHFWGLFKWASLVDIAFLLTLKWAQTPNSRPGPRSGSLVRAN